MVTGIRWYSVRCLKQDDVVAELRVNSIPYYKDDMYIKYMLSQWKDDAQHNGCTQVSV